jgi:hypothetical protein
MPKLHLKNICALALAASLAACAPPNHYFDKPGATNQSFNADKLDCTQIANVTTPGYSVIGSIYMVAAVAQANQRNRQDAFDTCMQARGYTLQIGEQKSATPPQPVAPAAPPPSLPPVAAAPPSTNTASPAPVLANPTTVPSSESYDYEQARRQYDQAEQVYQSKLRASAGDKQP